ncbi:MAG: HD domain-containing protein [bacterium]|nr:HD domain-containing protein [bacterium]
MLHIAPKSPVLQADKNLSDVEWSAVQTLLLALRYRDEATYLHSLRVASLAYGAAARLGLSAEALQDVLLAGLLHDIGKLALPDHVLLKTGRLNKHERKQVARHPSLSADILAPFARFHRIRQIILEHHERYDGSGYPDGRRAEEILTESAILAAADAFDAVCMDRPYRRALTQEEAVGWMESEVARQFNPVAFYALLAELESGNNSVVGVRNADRTAGVHQQNILGVLEDILSY